MDDNGCKPRIDYPCPWGYKVIGRDRDLLSSAIAEVLAGCAHTVTPAHSSKGGAYHCLNVETTVGSEAERLAIYERLRCHAAIVMVL
jgi:putative lipoic acid-binding regulatory protein